MNPSCLFGETAMRKGTRSTVWLLATITVFLSIFLGAPRAVADDTVIYDTWTLMKMAGDAVGWIHTSIHELSGEGPAAYRTEVESKMEFKRFGQVVAISVSGWTEEDKDGRILTGHQESLMSGTETLYDLVVTDGEATMTITTMGKPRESALEWDDEVVGPMGTWRLRKAKGVEPGTKYSVKTFTFDHSKVVTQTTEIIEPGETTLTDGKKTLFNRSISTTDILPGVKTYEWWDDDYDVVKTSTAMMGMEIETVRTTRERAMQSGGGELKTDMIVATMARANVNLPRPYRLDSILYRFEATNPDIGIPEGLDSFRQTVRENDGKTALVFIEAKVPDAPQKRPIENPPPELAEYLEPNAFIQNDHPGLKKKALEVIGGETDAWKAAVLLEKFVQEYIVDKNFGTGFATAAEVFENPRGDCSEHGVLLVALCRAVGIPSRVAVGYMYLGGIFGGHMWAEVWINGKWYAIDGVTGIGRVDPTHITFSTASIKDGGLAEEFVGVVQALGNLDITILEFTHGDKTVAIGDSFKDYIIDGNRYTNVLHGISITKPDNSDFEDYERDFSNVDFTLVEIDGETDTELMAMPTLFSQSLDDLEAKIVTGKDRILSKLQRKVCGYDATVYMIKSGKITKRVLALITEDTCFILGMRVEDEERDVLDFEKMVKSIEIAN